MRKQRLRIAFIVDDNLIGNKKAIKAMLRDVAAWQAADGYPLTFFTEASIDLAEDAELMQLMVEANITVGVHRHREPRTKTSLRETKKYQNVRKGGTILETVRRVQDAGLEVWCGMIVGFDNDDATDLRGARSSSSARPTSSHAMVGMLSAIPKTPLHARLEPRAGSTRRRAAEFGTNVIPLGMTREELRDGYVGLMRDLYDPDFYFERLENLYLTRRFDFGRARSAYWRQHPWLKWRSQTADAARALGLFLLSDEERARPGATADLSASDGEDTSPSAGSRGPVRLRGQVRGALPPLHDVARDVRTPDTGQHVLISWVLLFTLTKARAHDT